LIAGESSGLAAPPNTIIFVHPPRTGGSTLIRVIDWEYSPLEVCDIDGRFYFWSIQRMKRWPPERLAKMRVFKGHMPFGLHTSLPQPATYITILRDPIDRTISEYYFRLHRRTHPLVDRDAKRLSFDDYIREVPYNNPQTKAIAGIEVPFDYHFYSMVPSHRLYCGPCTRDTLELAKANLDRYFCLVGLTDRFDETLALAKILFGWKAPYYTLRRQALIRPKADEITCQQRALIAKYHEFDMELYKFGVSLFNRLVAEHAEPLSTELSTIGRARHPTGIRSTYYRYGSKVRRYLIRAHCAL